MTLLGLVLWLGTPGLAQTWFTPAKLTPTEMLRCLFRQPVPQWKSVLREHEELLDDQFLENVHRRVHWGLDNQHIDDALRFAIVGDMVLEMRSRAPYLRDRVSAQLQPPVLMIQPCNDVFVSFHRGRNLERAKALRHHLVFDLVAKTVESAVESRT